MNDIKYLWDDCTKGFMCPNCGHELQVDSQAEPTVCECGHVFELIAYVNQVKPKNEPGTKTQTLKIHFNDPVSPELAERLIDDLVELVETHGLTMFAVFGEEEVEEVDDGEQT